MTSIVATNFCPSYTFKECPLISKSDGALSTRKDALPSPILLTSSSLLLSISNIKLQLIFFPDESTIGSAIT